MENELQYIKKRFYNALGYCFDINNIVGFNSKIQYKKLFDRNPLLVTTSDKFLVRDYVRSKISDQILIELYGVYYDIKDINLSKLNHSFVMKATHGSGWVKIVTDNNTDEVIPLANEWLNSNYYDRGQEWAYKDITPAIIIEKSLGDNINDYKFFCFDGEPVLCQCCYNRLNDLRINFYTMEWELLNLTRSDIKNTVVDIKKPSKLQEMIEVSRILSSDFDFVRVDLYCVDDKVYFGELTHYPCNGFMQFIPSIWDFVLGSYWNQRKYK